MVPNGICSLALSLLLMSGVFAHGDTVSPMDLDQCIRQGLANNLQLRNARLNTKAASEGIISSKSVYDSAITFGVTRTDSGIADSGSVLPGRRQITDLSSELTKLLPGGARASVSLNYTHLVLDDSTAQMFSIPPYSSTISFSISQSLLRNALGSLDRGYVQYAELNAEMATQACEREEDMLVLTINNAYWQLFAVQASYQIGTESLALARQLLRTNREKYEDGLLDETDILAAEASIATRTVSVLAMSNAVANASDQLARTIHLPADTQQTQFSYPTPGAIAASLNTRVTKTEDVETALTARSDMKALRIAVRLAELDVDMKRNALRPDLFLLGRLSRGGNESDFGDTIGLPETGWTIGLQFTSSLPGNGDRSALNIAMLSLKAARNNRDDLKSTIRLECQQATRLLMNSIEQVSASRTAFSLHRKKIELELKKFGQGRSDTRWVIQAQDELTRARMNHHIALADYGKARAAHHAALGLRYGEMDQ